MNFPVTIFDGEQQLTMETAEQLTDFAKNYRVIYAAGGIVKNESGQILMIYRLGKWDFPKGKVEPDEGVETTACREVAEETAVSGTKIIHELPSTFHTYSLNGQKILKRTFWFLMQAENSNSAPIPQESEDITEAVWVSQSQVQKNIENSYASLQDLYSKIKTNIF
ncbi:MAG: NUDIX domain-containing protein [Bacteroidales bacterium]|nr:NUDIX domain-containing protein [Bacteroidales bacterium]